MGLSLGSTLLSALAASALVAQQVQAVPTDAQLGQLFKRAPSSLKIGSDEWKAQYPPGGQVPTPKDEWLAALKSVVDAGLIPNIPVATLNAGWPSYSDGTNPQDPKYCHYTVGCIAPSDKIDAPDGMIGISQDDGPLPPGRELNAFFKQEKISATHFFIGANIVENWDIALEAHEMGNQNTGVHTWSHGYSSGQTNAELVAEIGWTMQIIADVTGGRIPAFWRPPFGDIDNRVRAVAKEVFGLETIIWNQDSEDWTLGAGATLDKIQGLLQGFIDGPKSPGLIMLEHQSHDGCVTAFKNAYPKMLSQGWTLKSIPDLWNLPWYKNAQTDTSEVFGSIGITNTSAVSFADSSSSSSVASSSSSSAASSSSSSAAASKSASSASTLSSSASSAPAPSASNASSGQQSSNNTSSASLTIKNSFALASLALVASVLLI